MTLQTIAGYLCGNRRSIVEVARNPQAIWVALLFVLSAGFAREYDGEDLLAEPWHLLLPLGASLLTATVLFGMVWPLRVDERAEYPSYRSFLTLYWMTAPLAWLYAIPFERFLSAGQSVRANLWLLAIVSLWRVLLMSRVVSVLYCVRYWMALSIVMLFGDTIALIVLYFTPLPIFNIMGGIRLTESEQIIQGTALFVGFWGTLTWPVWLIASLAAIYRARKDATSEQAVPLISDERSVSPTVWALAIAAIVVWAIVLPQTQPEQQRRRHAEQLLRDGQIAEALAFMSQFEQQQFPPHWDPPPRVGYGEETPSMLEMMEAVHVTKVVPWVRQCILDKFVSHFGADIGFSWFWHHVDEQKLERYLRLYEELPEGKSLAQQQGDALRAAATNWPLPLRERVCKLLDLPPGSIAPRESSDNHETEPPGVLPPLD